MKDRTEINKNRCHGDIRATLELWGYFFQDNFSCLHSWILSFFRNPIKSI